MFGVAHTEKALIGRCKRGHIRSCLVAMAGCIALLGCTSMPRLDQAPTFLADAAIDPLRWFSTKRQTSEVDLLYVTDRKPEKGGGYGSGRSRSLAFGSCKVQIGKNLPWQKLIEFSTIARRTVSLPLSIETPVEIGRFPDTPFMLALESGLVVDSNECLRSQEEMATTFRAELGRRLDEDDRKTVFIFIHGYNNSFEDAAYVLASIWHYLGRQGAAVVYTWPGGIGGLRGYTHDRESGEYTNFHLKQFLKLTTAMPEVEEVILIAHSRGTDIATTALRELFIEARARQEDPRQVYKISNLVLCSPDMDMQVMGQRLIAERVLTSIGRTTIYVSPYDRAIAFAGWLFESARRAGRMQSTDLSEQNSRNLAVAGNLDIISVTSRTDVIGHAYFHSNPSVSSDLIRLLRDGEPPGEEYGRPLIPVLPGYWELPTGYPNNKVPQEAIITVREIREKYIDEATQGSVPMPTLPNASVERNEFSVLVD